ncbi:MAG: [Fe-S]-binding protein [Chloroflexi bacterium]|nr:MAG: [Fe-S]-binding protein [Chloroflexota bacterium]
MARAGANPDKRRHLREVDRAVADESLATALGRALPEFRRRRERAFASGDFPELRRKVHNIKADAIDRLPELIEQFTREAEAVGAVVHWANTADDARRIVAEIAQNHGAKLAVKSKSMATEEILLNPALEAIGVKVVETDLGEWIMQLAGEHPSHLIAPAIHKTREQVAEILSKEVGKPLEPDIAMLVQVAREQLRQAFIDADLGISGANAAIAETGTIMIVTNEGNSRLVTTLPPVHIAILGVDKIVPSLDDAMAIVKVLPRSGTGQKITSYVSFVTGPSRSADIELTLTVGVHGPKEVHIVLLDNGRMAARDDAELSPALHCIRCGACSNVCPPYQIVGGHVFGHIYTGPIGLVLTAMHHGLEHAAGPQSLCVSCNACEMVCPVEIPIPRMILDVRARAAAAYGLPAVKAMAISRWSDPKRGERWAGLAARTARVVADSEGVIKRLPLRPAATQGRTLRAPAVDPLRNRIRRSAQAPAASLPSSKAAGLRVAYVAGCMTERLLPEMGEAVYHVLRACGCTVEYPVDQHCCGLVALNVGDRDHGRVMAQQTIRMLEGLEVDYVVTNSTSCLVAIAQDYQHLFREEPDWQHRAAAVSDKLVDFTTFISTIAQLEPTDFARVTPGPSVTWHDACQSKNALGLGEDGRRIVRDVLGLQLVEMEDSAVCCGFGGSFSIDYPNVSVAILNKKLANAHATRAEVIVSDNPGCIMQLQGGLRAQASPVRAMHIAELIAERMRN